MARTVNGKEYAAKRIEIMDTALQLIYAQGFDSMSIQDILDRLGISKGAFYHYFESKDGLLAAIIDRMGKQAEQAFLPILEAQDVNAVQKFRQYFEISAQWKIMQKELVTTLMRMWYTDGNAVVRQKLGSESFEHTRRLLEPIIRQGIQEGVFTCRFPQEVAEIIARLSVSLSDSAAGPLLAPVSDPSSFTALHRTVEAFVESIERILGAPPGSLQVFEPDAFKEWFFERNTEAA